MSTYEQDRADLARFHELVKEDVRKPQGLAAEQRIELHGNEQRCRLWLKMLSNIREEVTAQMLNREQVAQARNLATDPARTDDYLKHLSYVSKTQTFLRAVAARMIDAEWYLYKRNGLPERAEMLVNLGYQIIADHRTELPADISKYREVWLREYQEYKRVRFGAFGAEEYQPIDVNAGVGDPTRELG